MRIFGSNNNTQYGVLIDIGSGSVLVAIIASDPTKRYPDIIWSKREYAPLRQISSVSDSAKNVMTSLLSALMLLDSEGRNVFREKTGKNKLPITKVTIAAPWSYTITKSIAYRHKESFAVTDDLVEELLRTAHKKIEEEIVENEKSSNLGLSVITQNVIGLYANGYTTSLLTTQQANSLEIIECNAIAQDYLIAAINDVKDKVLPDTQLQLYSFILVFYYIIRDIAPETTDYCLVDITYEATEIGVVRNGILNYTTHIPFGSFSIAREIAEIIKVPLEEAFGYLSSSDQSELFKKYSAQQQNDIAKVLENYQTRLTDLFHETGDSLSIPRRVYLHGNLQTELFFKKQISEAAKKATGAAHAIYLASTELLDKEYEAENKAEIEKNVADTALLISAQFFHKFYNEGK